MGCVFNPGHGKSGNSVARYYLRGQRGNPEWLFIHTRLLQRNLAHQRAGSAIGFAGHAQGLRIELDAGETKPCDGGFDLDAVGRLLKSVIARSMLFSALAANGLRSTTALSASAFCR